MTSNGRIGLARARTEYIMAGGLLICACSRRAEDAAPTAPQGPLPVTSVSAPASAAPTPRSATAAPALAPTGPTTAAPSVQGVAADPGTSGVALSPWFAPLFVKGNRWSYDYQRPLTAERQEKKVIACEVDEVRPLGRALLSHIVCQPEAGGIGGYYVASDRGLLVGGAAKAPASEPKGVELADPPRPFEKVTEHEELGCCPEIEQRQFLQQDVAGAGKVETYCVTPEWTDTGLTAASTRCYAAGLGIVSDAVDVGDGEIAGTSDLTLVSSALAPPIPLQELPLPAEFVNRPPSAAAYPAMVAAGLKCSEAAAKLRGVGLGSSPGLLGGRLLKLTEDFGSRASDLRPGVVVHEGKVTGTKSAVAIETLAGRVVRFGVTFSGKKLPIDVLGPLGAPAEQRDLGQGTSLAVFTYSDAALVVYRPNVDAPDYEWWLYDAHLWPAVRSGDAKVWEAFAANDAAMALGKVKGADFPSQIALYQAAVDAVPSYNKAWLRLCKAAQAVDTARAREACTHALQSTIPDVRNQAAKILKKLK